jgi:hypothetical protein
MYNTDTLYIIQTYIKWYLIIDSFSLTSLGRSLLQYKSMSLVHKQKNSQIGLPI